MITVIIPTFNERNNTVAIVDRINDAMRNIDYEVLFVDDSTDDTEQILKSLSLRDRHVRYIHRDNERGLATAVVKGFKEAKGNIVAVMDGDLQHPPELLPLMYEGIMNGHDVVIPSRFIPGGDDGGLNIFRKMISFTARCIACISIKSLRHLTDVTSGVFMIRKEVLHDAQLSPIGWKILIEILVKGHYQSVLEIPYAFQARSTGDSKMSMREQVNYMRHIGRIIYDKPSEARFLLLSLVGGVGVAINLLVFAVVLP